MIFVLQAGKLRHTALSSGYLSSQGNSSAGLNPLVCLSIFTYEGSSYNGGQNSQKYHLQTGMGNDLCKDVMVVTLGSGGAGDELRSLCQSHCRAISNMFLFTLTLGFAR